MSEAVITKALSSNGYHKTKPRVQVFLSLLSEGRPMSMSKLVKSVNSVDRASVYRTVALFEELGFIRRLSQGWKYTIELSDEFTEHHHHIRCLACGAITDIHDDEKLDAYIKDIARSKGYSHSGHELEISGLCSKCS